MRDIRPFAVARWAVLLLAVLTLPGTAGAADPDGTLKKIKASNTITMGFREASRPFSFIGDDGKPAGYSVELCSRVADSIAKQLGLPKLEIKCAVLDGAVLPLSEVKALATLPSREVVLAQLLGLLQAPASQLLRTLNEPAARLARLVDAIGKRQGGAAEQS